MSNKISNNEIEKLVAICRREESKILIGKYELSLNSDLIQLIHDFKDNNNSINYLRQLFSKSPNIKIIATKRAIDSVIYLSPFVSLVSLELIRISFKRLVGLENIRSQLKSLSCIKSIDTQVLDESFWDLFGVWPLLTTLKLSQNNLISVNASIIPSSVQTLDLSWNRIQVFDNLANYSVNSITKLDLSYNSLRDLPKLNTFTSSQLKALYVRGNLIENINGIEKLSSLSELDIAINCIIDYNSMISCLKQCKSLKLLWVEKNPFSCDKSVNDFIKQELSQLTQFNGLKIIRNPIEKLDSINNSDNKLNNKEVIKRDSNEENDEKSFSGSYDSQIDANSIKTNSSKRKKLRVAQIREQSVINEELERLVINDSNKDNKNENSNEAKELIKKRQELGDEWLVSLRPSFNEKSIVSSAIETSTDLSPTSTSVNDIHSLNLSISPPIAESMQKVEYLDNNRTKDNSNFSNDDDIEILAEEKTEWSRGELENDMNIILVECPETKETIFVYVREEDGIIFEKDCVTGKVLRTYDLKVLTSVEIINNSMLRLSFDSRVDSKRERKYLFDSIDSCHSFNDNFIIPWLSHGKRQSFSEEILYECLKCGLNKMSQILINSCPKCGSDAMMKNENRRRRSGSDITILSQIPQQISAETMPHVIEETNVWDELFSVNNNYNNSFFTRVDHSLKLYIEVKLFSGPSADDEVVEGLVKCKSMTGSQNKLESSLLVISSKKILILNINENEKSDNFESYLKLNAWKPISSLIQVKHLPNLLNFQGFWLEWKDNNKDNESKKSKSFLNRYSFGSKRSSLPESSSSFNLIIFDDELIGNSFLTYFNETINNSIPINWSNNQNIIFEDNSIGLNDELIIVHMIKSAEYKRNDMKNELKLSQNIAIVVTEKCVFLGEIHFDPNLDYRIKIIYKELIINLSPQIYINIKFNFFKLLFSDDNATIETQFIIYLSTTDSMKKILAPIKSQWEKAFDVPMALLKF
jgi:DNA-directed RNA polymerase subunit RPC12/RpoP